MLTQPAVRRGLTGAAPRALRDDAADTVRGILLVALAYVVMTVGDVAGKWALGAAGVAGVMMGRGASGALTVAAFAVAEGDWRRLLPVRWRLVLLRSALHSLVSLSFYFAWLRIPLADAYAIGFTAPLIMTVLAVPMLGERIRWRRMLSTAIGFSGVLIMVQPGSALWDPALLVLIPGILAMAVTRIMTRQLSTTETAECLTFWLMLAHLPAGVLMLLAFPSTWALPADIWLALALLGVLNATAHWLMARAYALAPVAAVAPYEYTMLIWGGIAGFVVFHEVPGWSSLAGAVVVAAAGLYNLHRERVRREAAR